MSPREGWQVPSDPESRPQWWQAQHIGFDELLSAAKRSASIRGGAEVIHRHGATMPCSGGGCVVVAPDGSVDRLAAP